MLSSDLSPTTNVGRTFPDFSFFGVIFRQYPVAVLCPQGQDLKCANVFFVKGGQVDFVATYSRPEIFLCDGTGSVAVRGRGY